jgi:hypothetical protein
VGGWRIPGIARPFAGDENGFLYREFFLLFFPVISGKIKKL